MEDHGRSAPAHSGRSCMACRRRKIRCDREQPCGYCSKMGVDCTYQVPGPSHKKPSTNDILARLENIESSLRRIETRTGAGPGNSNISDSRPSSSPESQGRDETNTTEQPKAAPKASNARLLFEEGDTRYVTDGLWTVLDDGEEGDTEDEGLLANEIGSTFPKGRQARLALPFSLNATTADTTQLHPTESRIFALWQVFIVSVDPVLKLLHIPTTQRLLSLACQNTAGIPPAFESLMFAIFYASVASMHSSVSYQTLTLEERQAALSRYGMGVEQSLAKANFMCVPNVTTLQALVLYLTCARQVIDSAYIWAMTGLLIRLATKLGLHRDPALLSLPPFVAEMRRRLWWQICILDTRIAEDNDTEPLIAEYMYDTKFPANINDSDLDSQMIQPPVSKQSRTEMLFTLVRFEITYASRKLVFSPKFAADNGYSTLSVQEKTDAIDDLVRELNEKYLQDYDENIPICFLAKTSIPMVLGKIKLTVNHPSRAGKIKIPQERLGVLIRSAVDIIRYAHGLRTNSKYSKWVWLFQKYIEWDAVAFLFHAMSAAASPDMFSYANDVIAQFFEDWSSKVSEGDRRWQRLQNLRAKAVARQTAAQSHSEATRQQTTRIVASELSILDMPHDSSNNQESLPLQEPSAVQDYNASFRQSYATQQSQTPYDDGLWNTDGVATWDFDNFSYGTRGAASWEMNVDDDIFMMPA